MLNTLPLVFDRVTNIPQYVVALFFFGPIVVGIIWVLYNRRFDRLWKAGIFPEKYKFTRDHLLEAYLALAALIIQLQRTEAGKKIVFVNTYFNRYFPGSNYNFTDSLLYSFKHPIKLETVTHWIKMHLTDEIERTHIVYFLVGITMVEGKISERELKLLAIINADLGLSSHTFERIIAMYQEYQKEKERKENNESTTQKGSYDQKKRFALILGINENADLTEIKAAYRAMVKLHHPDRFQNSGSEQIKIAEEKFIQIQRAYEYLKGQLPQTRDEIAR